MRAVRVRGGDICCQMMNDKLNITIRIADQPAMSLSINRDDEECIRMAEYNVNRLWNAWSTKFKTKTSREVLAMVAFRFAELFYRLNNSATETTAMLENFEKNLDDILLEMES